MAEITIKAYWSDDNNNTDGIYLVHYPDNANYKDIITSAQILLEEAKNNCKEDFIESNKETLLMFACTKDDYEYLSDYYDNHYGCSLLTILDFICEKLNGWSYKCLNYDTYDLVFSSWE